MSDPGPFGALLRKRRETAKLTREALARRAGLSEAAIKYLERGTRRSLSRISRDRLIEVAELGLTLPDFAGLQVGRVRPARLDVFAVLRRSKGPVLL